MKKTEPYIVILGIAQDGGYPHAGCYEKCCLPAWKNHSLRRNVSCMAIVDPFKNLFWLIDATPDFARQIQMVDEISKGAKLDGILLTHAHSGHYTGLSNLGEEAMNTKNLKVYAEEKMTKYLSKNQPWKQLIRRKNIKLLLISNSIQFSLSESIKIKAFYVPHRGKFSDMLGFRIEGNTKSVIYIPDIDSWNKWRSGIVNIIKSSDRIYLDGTFFSKDELPEKRISRVPHPFISETIRILEPLPKRDRNKIYFIHLNHTNLALKSSSAERKEIKKEGYNIAEEKTKFKL